MSLHRSTLALLAVMAIAGLLSVPAGAQSGNIKHVLLISVDGLHALDVANYVQNNPGSALAELSSHGVPTVMPAPLQLRFLPGPARFGDRWLTGLARIVL